MFYFQPNHDFGGVLVFWHQPIGGVLAPNLVAV